MRKMMYFECYLHILHNKRHTLTFSRRHRETSILFTLKRKSFRGFEKVELNHCSFYAKTEIFGFVLFHLKIDVNDVVTTWPICFIFRKLVKLFVVSHQRP